LRIASASNRSAASALVFPKYPVATTFSKSLKRAGEVEIVTFTVGCAFGDLGISIHLFS
jgi:hypothetical protein